MTKTRINWEEVRKQLRASELALEEALAENPARIQAVFRRRAAQLARNQIQTASRTPPISVLIFFLQAEVSQSEVVQSERFAIRLQELAEVLPFRQCTPVPGTPPEYLGVISRHGELHPVVDLARIVTQTVSAETKTPGFVLMLRQPGRRIGLRVDRVEGLREIAAEQTDRAWQGSYTTKISGEPLLLLDVPRVLGALLGDRT